MDLMAPGKMCLTPGGDGFDDVQGGEPSYRYSTLNTSTNDQSGNVIITDASSRETLGNSSSNAFRGSIAPRTSSTSDSQRGSDVFVRGSLLDRHIEAAAFASKDAPEKARDYKGRIRTWPGLLVLLLMVAGACVSITYYANVKRDAMFVRAAKYQMKEFKRKSITDGNSDAVIGDEIISDDGIVGNPKKYPASACELPNYLSKDGHIVAVSANGTEVPLKIKGINWFGMETGQAMPFGLWDNSLNGTTAYQIALFLSSHNYNSVRLPLMATWLLTNKVPNTAIINKQENRAVSVKNYMALLKSIIKVLQFRKISVLLSMHTLTFTDNGKLWYNEDVPEEKFLDAIDVLTRNLCTQEYWNVMGIDLKNEPYKGTWGDGTATDFRAGAKRIADRMLEGCDKWMGFVEGVNDQHTVDIDGEAYNYYDWYGGGLQGAKTKGLEFSVENKVVWAPHYYTPAVFPQQYLYGGGTVGTKGVISGYVELDDDTLRHRIKVTMDDMFGFLSSETGPALLLGEFGGLYARDLHPLKTTKRCTDFTMEIIKQPGWAGGYVWSLNPESAYQFNPADTYGQFTEGMLVEDWLTSNHEFVEGLKAMDDMENLKPFPCFPADPLDEEEEESSSDSGSGSP